MPISFKWPSRQSGITKPFLIPTALLSSCQDFWRSFRKPSQSFDLHEIGRTALCDLRINGIHFPVVFFNVISDPFFGHFARKDRLTNVFVVREENKRYQMSSPTSRAADMKISQVIEIVGAALVRFTQIEQSIRKRRRHPETRLTATQSASESESMQLKCSMCTVRGLRPTRAANNADSFRDRDASRPPLFRKPPY